MEVPFPLSAGNIEVAAAASDGNVNNILDSNPGLHHTVTSIADVMIDLEAQLPVSTLEFSSSADADFGRWPRDWEVFSSPTNLGAWTQRATLTITGATPTMDVSLLIPVTFTSRFVRFTCGRAHDKGTRMQIGGFTLKTVQSTTAVTTDLKVVPSVSAAHLAGTKDSLATKIATLEAGTGVSAAQLAGTEESLATRRPKSRRCMSQCKLPSTSGVPAEREQCTAASTGSVGNIFDSNPGLHYTAQVQSVTPL
jgi:hypothetical protein